MVRYVINAKVLREQLSNAALSRDMTGRVARAYKTNASSVWYCLKMQGTSIRKLLEEERERRVLQWIENKGSLDEIHDLLGYTYRSDTSKCVKKFTGKTAIGWNRIWKNKEKSNGQ